MTDRLLITAFFLLAASILFAATTPQPQRARRAELSAKPTPSADIEQAKKRIKRMKRRLKTMRKRQRKK